MSPCSFILVTVKRRKDKSRESSMSKIAGPRCVSRKPFLHTTLAQSTAESLGELEEATNDGHSALALPKARRMQDLQSSIDHLGVRSTPAY